MKLRARRREALIAYTFLAPCLAGLVVLFLYPLITNVFYSFTRYNLLDAASWVGWSNYEFMFTKDTQVWQAIGNTVTFTLLAVPGQILYAITLAVLVTSVNRGSRWYRTLYYLPALLPPVAATMGFAFVFNPGRGIVNQVLGALGLPTPLWLYSEDAAKWVFLLMVLWAAGNTVVVMIAGVLDVPAELYEAASIDGANAWERFLFVTIPSLRPVLVFSTVTGLIATLQFFTQPFVANSVATNSGAVIVGYPNGATMYYTTWIYLQAFSYFNVGYASALSTVLFVVAMVFTIIVLKLYGSDMEGEA